MMFTITNMKSKLIGMMGSPASGKSTLASSVHTQLKKNGKNSILVQEIATDFIAENGIPNTPLDQLVIFYKQIAMEKMFVGTKEYIVCDSSSLLNYIYFRKLFDRNLSNKDIATINHLQKEILKSLSQWDYIFYNPVIIQPNIKDGIRFQDQEQIIILDRCIKSYLEIENIKFIDLSDVELNRRTDYIIDMIQ